MSSMAETMPSWNKTTNHLLEDWLLQNSNIGLSCTWSHSCKRLKPLKHQLPFTSNFNSKMVKMVWRQSCLSKTIHTRFQNLYWRKRVPLKCTWNYWWQSALQMTGNKKLNMLTTSLARRSPVQVCLELWQPQLQAAELGLGQSHHVLHRLLPCYWPR